MSTFRMRRAGSWRSLAAATTVAVTAFGGLALPGPSASASSTPRPPLRS
jgi:hypothetical protein